MPKSQTNPSNAQSLHWLVKQEPSAYPWEQFVKDGKTSWTGIRNFQARNFLREMRAGDHVLYYHSVVGKAVVGVAKVTKAAFPDPTAEDGDWSAVELAPVKALKKPVTLDQIKTVPSLANIGLLKQSRLSTMPLSPEEYQTIVSMGS